MNTNDIKFIDKPTNITLNSVVEKCTDDQSLISAISLANILIAPLTLNENRDELKNKNIFPVGTVDFFQYLQKEAQKEVTVDIATKDEDYLELAQHSAIVTLPTIIISGIFLPIVTGLIANYIYEKLKVDNTIVKSRIIISTGDEENRLIEYEGPADQYEYTLSKIVE